MTFFIVTLSAMLTGCSQYQCSHCEMREWPINHSEHPNVSGYYQAQPELPSTAQLSAANRYLWVFLEGDGRPWSMPHIVAKDPTSKQKLALQLMAATPVEGLYINRPCYDQKASSPCHSRWWTSHRYHKDVAASINNALDQALKQRVSDGMSPKPLVVIGHSGGANLAMQLANMREDVALVATLAGNLDHTSWTTRHGYTPLEDSVDIDSQPLLPPSILRLHFAGTVDTNIPPLLVIKATESDTTAKVIEVDSDHHGWIKPWPSIWPTIVDALVSASLD